MTRPWIIAGVIVAVAVALLVAVVPVHYQVEDCGTVLAPKSWADEARSIDQLGPGYGTDAVVVANLRVQLVDVEHGCARSLHERVDATVVGMAGAVVLSWLSALGVTWLKKSQEISGEPRLSRPTST